MQYLTRSRTIAVIVLFACLMLVPACRSDGPGPEAEVTEIAESEAEQAATAESAVPTEVPATSTMVATQPPPATSTPRPTVTRPPPTPTPDESPTPEASPTETATATASPTNTRPPVPAAPTKPPGPPTLPRNPTLGQNLLPNPSFEEGHYNQNGIAELQLPNGWRLDYQEGPTGFGGQVWDVFVRPETRVLSTSFLPPAEHALYIFDGSHTVKIFKGTGAVSTRLMTDVTLQPGTYVLEGSFFSDVFESFSNGQKNPPSDPSAGEAQLFAGVTGTGWVPNSYLNRNTLKHTFTINSPQTITVGIGFRGRYAIANNGWFVDNLLLRQLQ